MASRQFTTNGCWPDYDGRRSASSAAVLFSVLVGEEDVEAVTHRVLVSTLPSGILWGSAVTGLTHVVVCMAMVVCRVWRMALQQHSYLVVSSDSGHGDVKYDTDNIADCFCLW
jgi:hypothetical protein